MENEKKKKGFWARLTGCKGPGKSPCCGGFAVEEVPEEKKEENEEKPAKDKNRPCCG